MSSKSPQIKFRNIVPTERYSITAGTNLFRVMDAATSKFTKGRFHTYTQAEKWIDDELARQARTLANQTKGERKKMSTLPPAGSGSATIITANGVTTTTYPNGTTKTTTTTGGQYYGGTGYTYVACKHDGSQSIWKYGKTTFVVGNYDGCKKAVGVDVVLDLNNNMKAARPFVEDGPERFVNLNQYFQKPQLQSEIVHLDWPDMQAPPAPLKFWEKMLKALSTSDKVMITCHGGHGRSGTALAALIVASGEMNGSSAIKFVRKNHCDKAVESVAQEDYLYILGGEEPPKTSLPKYQRYTHCSQCRVKFKEASKTPDNICVDCDEDNKAAAKVIKEDDADDAKLSAILQSFNDDENGPVIVRYFACKRCSRGFEIASQSDLCADCILDAADEDIEDRSLWDANTGNWKFPEIDDDSAWEALELERENRKKQGLPTHPSELTNGYVFAGLDEL